MKALRELERSGHFVLPAALGKGSRNDRKPRRLAGPLEAPREVPAKAGDVQGLRLIMVESFVETEAFSGPNILLDCRLARMRRAGPRVARYTASLRDGPRGRLLREELQHKTADRLKRAIAINLVIAWRIMLITLLGRTCPDLPSEVLFSDIKIEVLTQYAKKKALGEPIQLGDAVRLVARLGGYIGRAKDPAPGHQIMWHGYAKLQTLCEDFALGCIATGRG